MVDGFLVMFLTLIMLLFILFFVCLIIIYNGIIKLRNNIDKSWANIGVLLKQRSNEIPNLVQAVKGYMTHERKTLESLTKARSVISEEQSFSRKAAVDSLITDLLKTIFVVAEDYPELKAGENFLKLQTRITGLENELADRREFYNDGVTIYNTRIQSFPDLLIARLMHLTPIALFKAKDEDAHYIEVNF